MCLLFSRSSLVVDLFFCSSVTLTITLPVLVAPLLHAHGYWCHKTLKCTNTWVPCSLILASNRWTEGRCCTVNKTVVLLSLAPFVNPHTTWTSLKAVCVPVVHVSTMNICHLQTNTSRHFSLALSLVVLELFCEEYWTFSLQVWTEEQRLWTGLPRTARLAQRVWECEYVLDNCSHELPVVYPKCGLSHWAELLVYRLVLCTD